jgi:Rieske Fe-S protein
LIAPALREDKAGAPVAIGKLEDIPVGQFHPFSFTITKVNGWERTASNYGGYIFRRSESPDDILVLSSRCTHLSCTVKWNEETGSLLSLSRCQFRRGRQSAGRPAARTARSF